MGSCGRYIGKEERAERGTGDEVLKVSLAACG